MNDHPLGQTEDEAQTEAGLHVILDDLALLVENARAMPMSSSVLVHKADALALVDEMRQALPEQLAHADEVLAEANAVLEDANRQAEDILNTARARAIELVQKEQVAVQAESRARAIVEEAERTAAELRVDADDYCDRRLAEFEVDLGKVMAQVHAGRAKLAQRIGDYQGQADGA
ncbi:ATP synthase F0 subunit B [Oerskovia sp. KBS0722]|uniref:ATP synthase F0 subunit B n=1 Tax=Oerskovia sp. KBS0722 TaxID=1179673 RepID=UPI00110ECB66|nr:ATP synthase F0 subunit B [Oerskovia sp. KBS0722]QDW62861.1 ATP synthase F0 subunit B [Oerskovia sp. KBS0722]